jgi:uncharacterized membrane protein YcaP (DUF421 family)
LESILRAVAVYLILFMLIRLSGRRTLSNVTPFDMVLLIIIAEATQQALLGDDPSTTNTVLVVVTLLSTDVALSLIKGKSPLISRLIQGVPTVLISGGRVDVPAMRRARIELPEVLEAARQQHAIRSFDEIDCAILEVTGRISILPVKR